MNRIKFISKLHALFMVDLDQDEWIAVCWAFMNCYLVRFASDREEQFFDSVNAQAYQHPSTFRSACIEHMDFSKLTQAPVSYSI